MRKRLRLEANSSGNRGWRQRRHSSGSLPGRRHSECSPSALAAAAATETAVPTAIGPFNTETAMEIAVRHGCADLVIATDIVPHAPDLFEFVAGLASILRPNGVSGRAGAASAVTGAESPVRRVPAQFLHLPFAAGAGACPALARAAGVRRGSCARSRRVPENSSLPCGCAAPRAPWLKGGSAGRGRCRRDAGTAMPDSAMRSRPRGEIYGNSSRTRRTAGRRVAAYGVATRGNYIAGLLRHHHRGNPLRRRS